MKEDKHLAKDLATEGHTIKVMVELYCRDHHDCQSPPCDACSELIDYAIARVKQCPLQEERTTCGKCEIHCYKPVMKKQIKEDIRDAIKYNAAGMDCDIKTWSEVLKWDIKDD